MRSHKPILFAVGAPNSRVAGIAQARSVFSHGVQHRLDVRRRAGDHAQDLAGPGLLCETLLQLVEQPHVLDGDDSLVGKGFEQLDLHRSEWANVDTTRGQRANKFPLLTKRYE